MKKIVLFCGAGMSSSLLVLKIRDAAVAANYECKVEAYSSTNPQYAKDADVVLIGPQIRFHLKDLQKDLSCPVVVIEDDAYGSMNGVKILAQVRKILKDE